MVVRCHDTRTYSEQIDNTRARLLLVFIIAVSAIASLRIRKDGTEVKDLKKREVKET